MKAEHEYTLLMKKRVVPIRITIQQWNHIYVAIAETIVL